MVKRNSYLLFIFIYFLFNSVSKAQQTSPASPSSSYNNDYFSKSKKPEEKLIAPQINKMQRIVVQGNKRIESSVIIRDSLIDTTSANEKALSAAIKNLYKTGYYEDVKIFKSDNVIFITVKENPIIDLVSIEGNKEITDDLILEEIETKSRNVFSTDQIKSDSDKIQTLYKRLGYFSTFVEPKMIKVDDSRVNIVFEVFEGKEARIKKINFINNKVFSDSTLKDVISSSEYRWYEFWGGNDGFDKDRINYDKDLLKKLIA